MQKRQFREKTDMTEHLLTFYLLICLLSEYFKAILGRLQKPPAANQDVLVGNSDKPLNNFTDPKKQSAV